MAENQGSGVVRTGEDLDGELRGLGVRAIQFKLRYPDGSLLVLENTFTAIEGPARHLHLQQDEWFYALESEFIVEVGVERTLLRPGDSLLAPRQIPHVWAHVGKGRGRIPIAFTPAGRMEAFFRTVTDANAMPPARSGSLASAWDGVGRTAAGA